MTMSQPKKPNQLKLYAPLPRYKNKISGRNVIIIGVILIIAAVAITRVVDSAHAATAVNSALSQQKEDNQIEGSDFAKLLKLNSSPLSCSAFQTSYDIQKCHEHNRAQ
ncbi:MAG: hypothetical protein ACREGA_04425 [Candidatus Saccharimonadales bacterium]